MVWITIKGITLFWDREQSQEITVQACFWQKEHNQYGAFNFVRAVFNICACAVILTLYGSAIRITWKAKCERDKLGQSPQGNIYVSVIIRLVVMILIISSVLLPLNMWLVMSVPLGNPLTLVAFLILNSLEASANPFIYTLSTRTCLTHFKALIHGKNILKT